MLGKYLGLTVLNKFKSATINKHFCH